MSTEDIKARVHLQTSGPLKTTGKKGDESNPRRNAEFTRGNDKTSAEWGPVLPG